jgi:superfamily I DNA and/or RNA helicase
LLLSFLSDREQPPILLLSKDFNEHAGQGELSTYERKMKAGFEGATLCESLKMHPRVLVYPSRKKYGGNLQAIEEAASRQFHPVYAKLACAYLGEDDPANIHVYVVDIAEAETFTSVYSKSRSNLHTAHEIVGLAVILRRSLEPPDFNLPDNIVTLAGHRDQVRTIIRVLADKMRTYKKRFKRAEFPEVTTIDDFQGRDKMIVFWDHVISHANKSSDIGFLKRRSSHQRRRYPC